MGNHLCSCFCPSKGVRVISFNGDHEVIEIIAVKKGMKIAEVMMENPNQFICNLGGLQEGNRIKAVPAHEEMKKGNTYVLFPMQRLRSTPSALEMNALNAHNLWGAKKNGRPNSKVHPVGEKYGLEKKALPKFEMDEVALKQWEGLKMGGCRYWKPTLHTINEFPTSKV